MFLMIRSKRYQVTQMETIIGLLILFLLIQRVDAVEGSQYLESGDNVFYRKLSGRRFISGESLLKSLTVRSDAECTLECSKTKRCDLCNVGASLNNNQQIYICELLSTYKVKAQLQWVEKQNNFYHYVKEITPIEQTCTKLKADGYVTSGAYIIDPDGLATEPPFEVFCDMSSRNGIGVAVISHDSENRTFMDGYEGPMSYKKLVTYHGATVEQVALLIRSSKNCEQFIKFECHGAVIHNDQGQTMAALATRGGRVLNYWGGASPGSGNCACGMTNTCANPNQRCNCDKNDFVWREDSGVLNNKDDLPITAMMFGDLTTVDANNEIGYHTLGKLECYG